MHAAADEEILARALDEDRIVVSADSDFSAILAAQEAERPSFILFREPNLLVARDYIDMLLPALPMLQPELLGGCLLAEPSSLAAFWQVAKCFRRALEQRRIIMSRRRASDEALARWFSFQPAAEPLNGTAALEPAARILEAGVSLSAL